MKSQTWKQSWSGRGPWIALLVLFLIPPAFVWTLWPSVQLSGVESYRVRFAQWYSEVFKEHRGHDNLPQLQMRASKSRIGRDSFPPTLERLLPVPLAAIPRDVAFLEANLGGEIRDFAEASAQGGVHAYNPYDPSNPRDFRTYAWQITNLEIALLRARLNEGDWSAALAVLRSASAIPRALLLDGATSLWQATWFEGYLVAGYTDLLVAGPPADVAREAIRDLWQLDIEAPNGKLFRLAEITDMCTPGSMWRTMGALDLPWIATLSPTALPRQLGAVLLLWTTREHPQELDERLERLEKWSLLSNPLPWTRAPEAAARVRRIAGGSAWREVEGMLPKFLVPDAASDVDQFIAQWSVPAEYALAPHLMFGMIDLGAQATCRRRLLIAAFAARAYKLERGEWPARLEDLAPEYLPTVEFPQSAYADIPLSDPRGSMGTLDWLPRGLGDLRIATVGITSGNVGAVLGEAPWSFNRASTEVVHAPIELVDGSTGERRTLRHTPPPGPIAPASPDNIKTILKRAAELALLRAKPGDLGREIAPLEMQLPNGVWCEVDERVAGVLAEVLNESWRAYRTAEVDAQWDWSAYDDVDAAAAELPADVRAGLAMIEKSEQSPAAATYPVRADVRIVLPDELLAIWSPGPDGIDDGAARALETSETSDGARTGDIIVFPEGI